MPDAVSSPSITATSTPTATVKPTPTPTPRDCQADAYRNGTHFRDAHITKIPGTLLVGGDFIITGTGFTDGLVVNLFVATGGPQFKTTLDPVKPHGALR